MPELTENFLASKSFTLIAAAIAFLAAAILFSVIFRLVSGRKLRLSRNGRARPPRLGTVDAFDLDRQRQLVIIRRDNVEHLLMIGGPNDLVIESQIIRAESREPRDFRDARGRDKEPREASSAGVSWPSVAEAAPPNPLPRKTPVPAPAAAMLDQNPGGVGLLMEDPITASGSSAVSPSVRPSAFPFPPKRPSPQPFVPTGPNASNQRQPLGGRADRPQASEPAAGPPPPKDFRRASVATPFVRPSGLRQTNGTGVRLAPSSAAEMPPAASNLPKPLSSSEDVPTSPALSITAPGGEPAAAAPTTGAPAPTAISGGLARNFPPQADVDTLEAEMAKLLGRGPS